MVDNPQFGKGLLNATEMDEMWESTKTILDGVSGGVKDKTKYQWQLVSLRNWDQHKNYFIVKMVFL